MESEENVQLLNKNCFVKYLGVSSLLQIVALKKFFKKH